MASEPQQRDEDKRKNPRLPVGFPAEFQAGKKSGRGLVRDLSERGAWVDRPSRSVRQGNAIRIKLQLGHNAIEMSGRVVRSTRNGFAVHFDSPNVRLQHLLQVALSRQSVKI